MPSRVPGVRDMVQRPSYPWRAGGAMRLTRMRGVPLAGKALGFGDLCPHHLIDRREHDDDTHPDGL